MNNLQHASIITGKDGKTYAPLRYIELWDFWYAVDSEGKSAKLRWNDIESYELPDGTIWRME